MLSSSHSKIHEPRLTGVSPRPTDQRQRQKTAKHETPCGVPELAPRSLTEVIGGLRRLGMIAAVSLRLLYLIFQQVLGLVLLMGRTSSTQGRRAAHLAA